MSAKPAPKPVALRPAAPSAPAFAARLAPIAALPPSSAPQPLFASGIRDNRGRGPVADFLRMNLVPGAHLDFVTAYFTVFS